MVEHTTVDTITSINFEDDWIVDSSCSHHLTKNDSKFSTFCHYDGNDDIITTNNTVHLVEQGVVTISSGDDRITLDSIVQVTGMIKNLFSVSIAVDVGHYVLFGRNDVKFLHNHTSTKVDIIHIGNRVKDLFVLSTSKSYVKKMHTNDSSLTWHSRLGHLSMDTLKFMVMKNLVNGLQKSISFSSNHVYEGC